MHKLLRVLAIASLFIFISSKSHPMMESSLKYGEEEDTKAVVLSPQPEDQAKTTNPTTFTSDMVNPHAPHAAVLSEASKNDHTLDRTTARNSSPIEDRVGHNIALRRLWIENTRNLSAQNLSWYLLSCASNLTHLILTNMDLGSQHMRSVAPLLPACIVHINLGNNRIETDGVWFLAQAKLPNLSELYLRGNGIGSKKTHFFAEASWKKLTVLDLTDNPLGELDILSLVRGLCDTLTRLYMGHTGINDTILRFLTQKPWPKLTLLDLRNNKITNQGAGSLGESCSNLRILHLGGNKMGDEEKPGLLTALTTLTGHPPPDSPRSMNDVSLPQTPPSLYCFPVHLTILNLESGRLGNGGVAALTQTSLSTLQVLILRHNLIDDQRMTVLTNVRWPKLMELDCANNLIGDAGAYQLVNNMSNFPQLNILILLNNILTARGGQILINGAWPAGFTFDLRDNLLKEERKVKQLAASKRYIVIMQPNS